MILASLAIVACVAHFIAWHQHQRIPESWQARINGLSLLPLAAALWSEQPTAQQLFAFAALLQTFAGRAPERARALSLLALSAGVAGSLCVADVSTAQALTAWSRAESWLQLAVIVFSLRSLLHFTPRREPAETAISGMQLAATVFLVSTLLSLSETQLLHLSVPLASDDGSSALLTWSTRTGDWQLPLRHHLGPLTVALFSLLSLASALLVLCRRANPWLPRAVLVLGAAATVALLRLWLTPVPEASLEEILSMLSAAGVDSAELTTAPLTKGPTQLLASSLVPLLLSTWSCMLAAYLALGPAQGQQSPAACLVSPGNSPATHENQQLDQDRPLSENPELDLQWALLLAIATVLLGTWAAITLSSRLPLGALATLMAPYLLLWLAWERARLRAQHGNHRQLVALFLAAWAFLAFSGRLGDGPVLLSQLEGETALHQRMHP